MIICLFAYHVNRLFRGPFDRLLLAQAKTEGMRFMARDEKFAGYDEPCILRV